LVLDERCRLCCRLSVVSSSMIFDFDFMILI
jgi:hypothetical protein